MCDQRVYLDEAVQQRQPSDAARRLLALDSTLPLNNELPAPIISGRRGKL